MDTQVVEIIGRNRLVNELLRAGLEVALPARDRGVDLIVYADLAESVTAFVSRPIQMKAASATGFSIHRKYARLRDLILAFVWNLEAPDSAVTFALSYPDAIAIGDALGWTQTASWLEGGVYSTSQPSKRLVELLEPHRMTKKAWLQLVTGASRARQ
jgi:hypothetical protein